MRSSQAVPGKKGRASATSLVRRRRIPHRKRRCCFPGRVDRPTVTPCACLTARAVAGAYDGDDSVAACRRASRSEELVMRSRGGSLVSSDYGVDALPRRALHGPVLIAGLDDATMFGALRFSELLARRDRLNAHVLGVIRPTDSP